MQVDSPVQSQNTDPEGGCLISHLRILAADQALADLLVLEAGDALFLRDSVAGSVQGTYYNWSADILGPEKITAMLASLIQQEADLGVCAAKDLPYPMPDQLDVLALIHAPGHPESRNAPSPQSHPLGGKMALISRSRRPELHALFHGVDIRRQWGKVWLIGFGPGDPELMTLKADRILHQVDIIYYDDLVDHAILQRYPGRKKYVGKRKGNHAEAQEAINELMCQSALLGRAVARLKGGDPFVFGRGGEETEYLLRRMIAVEVIPGVSAANAAAAAFNIPLSKRRVSWSVTLKTAHCGDGPRHSEEEGQTLVYYMAASRVASLSGELLLKGLNPKTPVALVQKASLSDEHGIVTTLEEMGTHELESPLLVIIGNVVRDRHRHRTLLYTGPDISGFRSNERLIHYPLDGGDFPRFGAISGELHGPPDLHNIDGIVFSSPSTVDTFVNLHGLPADWVLNYALDPATFERLHEHGIPRDRTVLLSEPRKAVQPRHTFKCAINS